MAGPDESIRFYLHISAVTADSETGLHMKGLFGMSNSLKDQPRAQIAQLERRLFLRRGLSLGALTLLSGCNVTDAESVQKVLWKMSRWNDRVQGWIFDPNRLAPEFPESAITMPFPFNAFYGMAEVPRVDA